MGERPSPYRTMPIDGEKVRHLREGQLHVSQQALAKRAGVTRGYLSMIETQPRRRLSYPVAERLAEALGVSVAELRAVDPNEVAAVKPTAVPVRRGFRRGAGLSVTTQSRGEILRAVLHETQEIGRRISAIEQQLITLLGLDESRT